MSAMIPEVERDGFALVAGVLPPDRRRRLLDLLGPVAGAGRRGLLGLAEIAEFAHSEPALALLRPHLPAEPFAVRAIYFDKTPGSNWLVSWHQDLTLALQEQIDTPGFGPWSVKDGVTHVQPPVELLEQMLTLRIHLDNTDEENGALRVLPGSHALGRLGAEGIRERRAAQAEFVCRAAEGDALLMRPLLLHASGRSSNGERHRRVLHIEYAAFPLPAPLQWGEVA